MKKVEIIIKPERLEELKTILTEHNAPGLMISNVMGYGNQKGFTAQYRGTKYTVNLLPKIMVSTVVSDTMSEVIIAAICSQMPTGDIGDGKIFVYDVADAVKVRTGQRGEDAL